MSGASKILVILGHPSVQPHYGAALAEAYCAGAREAGHSVTYVRVGDLDLPYLTEKSEHDHGPVPPDAARVQAALREADHLVLVFPLWHGMLPAKCKSLLEHVFRPGYAYTLGKTPAQMGKHLRGKSARIIITMTMPALAYRLMFGAYSLRALKVSVLGFCGMSPLRHTLIGSVAGMNDEKRVQWLQKIAELGRRGI